MSCSELELCRKDVNYETSNCKQTFQKRANKCSFVSAGIPMYELSMFIPVIVSMYPTVDGILVILLFKVIIDDHLQSQEYPNNPSN